MQQEVLRELTQNKNFTLKLQRNQRYRMSTDKITVDGTTYWKTTWFIDHFPALEIVSHIPGSWLPLKEQRRGGFYFKPATESPYRWEVIIS